MTIRIRLDCILRPLHILFAATLLCAATQPPALAGEGTKHAGTAHFPVSCSAVAQARFDEAMALLHHMTYPAARGAFRQAAEIDPHCAMAHWGVAMTLFQPLWPTRPDVDDRRLGAREAAEARSLSPPTRREQLFVSAVEAFFADPDSAEYWPRIRRWEQAMRKVYDAYPGDPEAATLYALAHLATVPADRVQREANDEAAAILKRVLASHPGHPGAMHYLVHADDTPGRERSSLDVVREYASVAPDNPHALHMPTHIFTRIGNWDAVIAGNRRAAEAALKYPSGPRGDLVWDEFPHALEYQIYAYLQKGADAEAAAQLQRLRATPNLEPTFKTAFHLASTSARYALERRDWAQAARLKAREPATLDWDRFPWAEAIVHFARGLGSAHQGHIEDARTSATRIAELGRAATQSREVLFARAIEVLHLELAAAIAGATGNAQEAIAMLRKAADLEAATPKHAVTPGPTLPALELYGDLLLEQAKPGAALQAYRQSLERYPRRFNSVLGLARAARASGDADTARSAYAELLRIADEASRRPALAEARSYIAGPG